MLCNDTDCHEAIRFEHLKTRDLSKLEKIIQGFVDLCNGNGKVNLVISGGKIRFFEPTSRVPVDDEKKAV
jgi:hypothetical protein